MVDSLEGELGYFVVNAMCDGEPVKRLLRIRRVYQTKGRGV